MRVRERERERERKREEMTGKALKLNTAGWMIKVGEVIVIGFFKLNFIYTYILQRKAMGEDKKATRVRFGVITFTF